jgi:hypothetical protein
MTFGADDTTHCSINYDARHVHYKVESKSADGTIQLQQKTRLIAVHSTVDGSSEQSLKDWKTLLDAIADIYNQSPLAKRFSSHLLRTMAIFLKLLRMHTDHCAKEKKTV